MKLVLALAGCALAFPAAAQSENPLTQALMNRYQEAQLNLVETAEAMPEADYSYRLTSEQRTFGEWIAHSAMSNYLFCSAIRGEAPPDTSRLRALRSKAGFVVALKESFDYCDASLKGMDDRRALAPVTIGARKAYPVQGMLSVVVLGNEHYGNLVGYLRTKGIVPPSTARRKIGIPSPRPRSGPPEPDAERQQ